MILEDGIAIREHEHVCRDFGLSFRTVTPPLITLHMYIQHITNNNNIYTYIYTFIFIVYFLFYTLNTCHFLQLSVQF